MLFVGKQQLSTAVEDPPEDKLVGISARVVAVEADDDDKSDVDAGCIVVADQGQ